MAVRDDLAPLGGPAVRGDRLSVGGRECAKDGRALAQGPKDDSFGNRAWVV